MATTQIRGQRPAGFNDIYHFLVRGSWTRVLLTLSGTFLALNAIFGTIYMLVGGIAGAREGSFVDAFFFSVQTLATIGYGVMNPQTIPAHMIVTVEVMIGMIGMAMATGLVFAKFSRPKARLLFSKHAVISVRDGVETLMFRVANERQNHVVEATMRVVLLRSEKTLEGESIRRLYDLPLVRSTSPAFILTWTAMHQIIPGSPLYGETPESMKAKNGEILVTLLGVDEAVSQTIHGRHSYTADEIHWGMRLADLLNMRPDGVREIDYSRFHDIVPVPVPATEGRPTNGSAVPRP